MKLLTSLTFLLTVQLGISQVPELNFSWEIQEYDSLQYDHSTEFNPTDSTSYAITEDVSIGFDFEWFDYNFEKVRISSSGTISLLDRCQRLSTREYIPPITRFKEKNYNITG